MLWNKRIIQENPYPISPLAGKLLAMVEAKPEEIEAVLGNSEEIRYSSADCVLKAIERLKLSKIHQEKVLIAGDYDCDGICSTTIMKYTFEHYGIEHGYYIPDRVKEGYGLKPKTVQLAKEKGYSLILTVDNGVKAFEALELAKELGVEVIVSDHHQIEEEVPCDILVHPHLMEPEFHYLSGAGVALQLSYGLIGEVKELITMAGVAALADVMPPFRQTRPLIQRALVHLQEGLIPGFQKLLNAQSRLNISNIQYNLIPKLNSVGRLSHLGNVNQMVPYLLMEDEQTQQQVAKQIEGINQQRKQLSNLKALDLEKKVQDLPVEVLYEEDLLEGICGLIAGRLANKIQRPCLVLCKTEDDIIKGSGRSVPGIDLFESLKDFPQYLAFGGHEQACGISLAVEHWEEFQQFIKDLKIEKVAEKGKDCLCIQESDFSKEAVKDLEKLDPYPSYWKEAFFIFENPRNIELKNYSSLQKFEFEFGQERVEAVLYQNKGIQANPNATHFVGTLSINQFRQQEKIQMILEDCW